MAAVNRGRDIIVALLHLALWSQLGVLTRIYLDKLFSTCNLLEAWAGLQCMPDVGRWALLIAGMKGIFPQMSRQALGWPTELLQHHASNLHSNAVRFLLLTIHLILHALLHQFFAFRGC